MCSRPFETRSLPSSLATTHRGFAFYVAFPKSSIRPLGFAHDHSHPVLAPAALAALPSTRAIETRLLPSSLAATHRGFAVYVAFPKRSIPSLATCSMARPPTSFSAPAWRLKPVALSSEPRCWLSPVAVPCASDSLSEICHP
jgi:hypothetical protein